MNDLRDVSDLAGPDLVYRIRCIFSQSNYVPTTYQTLWSFDPVAAKEFGSEWILAANRKDGLYCGQRAQDSVQQTPQIKKIKESHGTKIVINWPDVKRLLLARLKSPDSMMSCGIWNDLKCCRGRSEGGGGRCCYIFA